MVYAPSWHLSRQPPSLPASQFTVCTSWFTRLWIPTFWGLCWAGPNNSRKIPANFLQDFSAEIKKIHRRASVGAQGEGTVACYDRWKIAEISRITNPPNLATYRRDQDYIRGFEKGLAGGGWRQTNPQKEPKKFSRNVSPFSSECIGKRVQKRGLNLWSLKGFFAPTPSVRQPLFETSDYSGSGKFLPRSIFRKGTDFIAGWALSGIEYRFQ